MPAPTDAACRNPVGSHVRVGRDLVRGALATAEAIGAETLQVFTGNPRGWAASEGDPRVDEAFRTACAERQVRAFVHAPYLVNLGSPTATTYERSVATTAHTLRRAAAIGAEGVVVHTGSCVAHGSYDAALRQVREGLLPLLDDLGDDGPRLLLEPTAGQGRSLCAGVEDLPAYLGALDHHPRLGICLDTCHVFAAGSPLDEPGGTTSTLDRLAQTCAGVPLALVHANDSQDTRGSGKDRHERIGEGRIGAGAFAELLAHPGTDGVPLVCETPGSGEDGGCLATLKALRDD
ncbi:deoxyribonuclease IV [Marmoricola endophyticus]|uniref:deoxyribonuclease IV n=1 Tax=Marmoricola endophyticus TaxID=2040280 RepID=UPI00166D43DF|nr:deoxyribonuclease IV [Marmoricola endophyticus]